MHPRFLERLLSRRRFLQTVSAAGVAGYVLGQQLTAAQTPGATPAAALEPSQWPLLLVDDAKTHNDGLQQVSLDVPNGIDVRSTQMQLPAGFKISVIAAGLTRPRFMAFDAVNNLLVADAGNGAVYRYPAADSGIISPAPQSPDALISGLDAPSNVAFWSEGGTTYLYVGETSQVSRYRYDPTGAVGGQEVVIPDLPTGGHSTRTIAFGPDGKLYLAVGSSCNICEESDERRAAILRYNPDGSDEHRIAHGLRNPVGLAFQPETNLLWATVNERDNQGNEIPPDLVTIVLNGANYGWPDCQPPKAKPQTEGDVCTGITPPTIGIQAHSAPLGLTFSTGSHFPADYQNGLFVAQHGSWNREPPAASKLLYVAFKNNLPVAARDFAVGWQAAGGDRWGRPAGVLAAPDGSLIVSDDTAGLLYRIAYNG